MGAVAVMAGDVLLPGQSARQHEARRADRRPPVDHRQRHLGVELHAERAAIAQRLVLEAVAADEAFGARRQLKALAMPVIDVTRPGKKVSSRLGGSIG